MRSGMRALFAETIEEKTVKKYCPVELKNLKNIIKKVAKDPSISVSCVNDTYDIEAFAQNIEVADEIPAEVLEAWRILGDAFVVRTGLTLNIGYHDKAVEGNGHDDVDGMFWYVDGMFQLSAAGKRMRDVVTRKFYVFSF